MNQKLTLSQLNESIKDALMDSFPTTVWVVAEVSELKENRSGHCYLELIEKECKPTKSVRDAVNYAFSVLPCGVVTSCSGPAAKLILKKTRLKKFFPILIVKEDVGEDAKPCGLPYSLGVFDELFVKNANCLPWVCNHRIVSIAEWIGVSNL